VAGEEREVAPLPYPVREWRFVDSFGRVRQWNRTARLFFQVSETTCKSKFDKCRPERDKTV